jgi:electron transport complex protein RnfB
MFIAMIREEECVGCTKCTSACPVDAIIGASTFMHSVLSDECIGCQLCIAPCPMDCIEMVEYPIDVHPKTKLERGELAKRRHLAKQHRFFKKQQRLLPYSPNDPTYKKKIQTEIEAAVARVKIKKDNLI